MIKSGTNSNNHDVIIDGAYPLEIINMERKRIANELHDGLIQSILGILYKSQLCVSLIDYDLPRTKDELKKIYKTAKEAVTETREIIYDLYSFTMDLPIEKLIKNYMNKMKEIWKFNVRLIIENETLCFNLKPIAKLSILRIIQEAVNNINKHSQASSATIEIKYECNLFKVKVKDNGKGFNLNELYKRENEKDYRISGFGLNIMKERITILGGELSVNSTEGVGTNIIVSISKKLIEENNVNE